MNHRCRPCRSTRNGPNCVSGFVNDDLRGHHGPCRARFRDQAASAVARLRPGRHRLGRAVAVPRLPPPLARRRPGRVDGLPRRPVRRAHRPRRLPPRRAERGLRGDELSRPAGTVAGRTSWPHRGRIARYALGDDYHELIKSRLHALADWLRDTVPRRRPARASTPPRSWRRNSPPAPASAGSARTPASSTRSVGSWLLLGEIAHHRSPCRPTTPATDRCGTCTRCIDACPTGAITAPVPARRPPVHLLPDDRAPRRRFPPDCRRQMGDWLYGCDICQDVCPWNRRRRPPPTRPSRRASRPARSTWRKCWGGTRTDYRPTACAAVAMKRVKLPVLQAQRRESSRRTQSGT